MSDIETKVKKVLKKDSPSRKESKQFKEFKKALDYFNELIKSGHATKRGNQQMDIEDAHLQRFKINK